MVKKEIHLSMFSFYVDKTEIPKYGYKMGSESTVTPTVTENIN